MFLGKECSQLRFSAVSALEGPVKRRDRRDTQRTAEKSLIYNAKTMRGLSNFSGKFREFGIRTFGMKEQING